MSFSRLPIAALLASFAVLTTTTLAFAAPNAIAKADASLRKNPSTSSVKVNTVEEDDELTITKCSGSWCFAKVPGPDGWIKKSLLIALDDEGDPDPEVPFNFGITMGPGGPSISFGVGDTPEPPPAPPAVAQVCLYHDVNFGGPFLCFTPGESDDHMVGAGYNDEISSIKVSGGAHVKVCHDWGFTGGCANIGTDKPFIGAYDESVSSFQVY